MFGFDLDELLLYTIVGIMLLMFAFTVIEDAMQPGWQQQAIQRGYGYYTPAGTFMWYED